MKRALMIAGLWGAKIVCTLLFATSCSLTGATREWRRGTWRWRYLHWTFDVVDGIDARLDACRLAAKRIGGG